MSLSEILSLIAIAISFLSVIAVFLSPIINSRLNKKTSDRESHKRDLINYALNPLIQGIETFLYSEFSISQIGYIAPDEATLKIYKNRVFDFTATIPRSKDSNDWFDFNLYQDYKNHNKDLYDDMEAVRIRLKKDMPIYIEKRWKLIIALSRMFEECVSKYIREVTTKQGMSLGGEENDLKMKLISIALMKMLDPDNPDLLPLESLFSGEKLLMLETAYLVIESSGIQSMAEDLSVNQDRIIQYLISTKNRIFEEATSGKKLNGTCHRLAA